MVREKINRYNYFYLNLPYHDGTGHRSRYYQNNPHDNTPRRGPMTRTQTGTGMVTRAPTGRKPMTRKPTGSGSITRAPAGCEPMTRTTTGSGSITRAPAGSEPMTRTTTGSRSITRTTTGSGSITRAPAGSEPMTKTTTGSGSMTRTTSSGSMTRTPAGSEPVTRTLTGNGSMTRTPAGNRSMKRTPAGNGPITRTPTGDGSMTRTPFPSGPVTKTPIPSGPMTKTSIPSGPMTGTSTRTLTASKFAKMATTDKNAKTAKNVRVAVRIRPMNDNEITEKARCAVTSNGRKRTIAVVDRGNTKEFGPFDKVYGPYAKQLDIYCDLVEPLVKNVLAGYNCTLFAYGQTSTGKTYTMEGEQISTEREHAWNEDSSVGIIPRALQHIFTELESQDAEEFSVRVSYVELYNEELYDLLGHGELGHARLRLFEDSVRKGSVIVSGLEEVPVSDRMEVRELLKRGAEKRRTAATQMNLNSSRSHTVFTITVVIRENTVSGEEVIKQGKLSLIDLAGSENIGRSGSIDIRAREAGNINQSLLTLGRVIMALTSGAGHVPYRESKLTRILQDSLGGKTITTIVATLSPASINIEETISTLEYASTAKNIKNQPEINQKLTHRALLKAYNDEMNRLMRDLQAARDKTGFFVDRQNYEDMNTQLAQQSRQIEVLTDELQSVLERVQVLIEDAELMGHHYGRLYESYKHMEEKYKERCNENARLNMELADCKSNLESHRVALQKLQESANQSQAENSQLRQNCTHLASELNKVHDKIDVFRSAASENEKLYVRCAGNNAESAEKLKEGIEGWNGTLQNELKTIVEYCEQTKCDVEKDMSGFRSFVASLRSQLTAFFNGFTKGMDPSVVSFIENIGSFIAQTEQCHGSLYEEHKRLCDFVMRNIKKCEQLGKDFYGVADVYTNHTLLRAEEMKRKINDALEAYINATRIETKQTSEKLKSLKFEQQFTFETECGYIKSSSELAASNKAHCGTLMQDFSKEVTVQNERAVETYKTMEALYGNLENQGEVVSERFKKMANSNADIAICQMKESEKASLSLLKEVKEAHSRIEQFVEKDVIRPPETGETPKRVKQVALPEPVEIPNANELINKGRECKTPLRLSQYRPRDSILEASFTVLSPGALKETLKSELDDIYETTVNGDEIDGAACEKRNTSTGNVTKRRRVFQHRNS